MTTQIFEATLETVTYQGEYPELSGYGSQEVFKVVMDDNSLKTAVIEIGGRRYFHSQLQDFLNEAAAFIEVNAR